jgi:hypothetical protein
MPLAGAHVVLTIGLLAFVRKFLKIKFNNRLLLLGGALGLLPDLDIPIALAINFVFGTNFYFHKIYTHAFIIPLALFLIALVMKKTSKFSVIIFITALAWLTHLVLDCYLALGQAPSILPAEPGIGVCRELLSLDMIMNLDAALIVLAVLYLAYKTKVTHE